MRMSYKVLLEPAIDHPPPHPYTGTEVDPYYLRWEEAYDDLNDGTGYKSAGFSTTADDSVMVSKDLSSYYRYSWAKTKLPKQ